MGHNVVQSLQYKHKELPHLNKEKLLLVKLDADALTLNYFKNLFSRV